MTFRIDWTFYCRMVAIPLPNPLKFHEALLLQCDGATAGPVSTADVIMN
jgi:hypothetical protein